MGKKPKAGKGLVMGVFVSLEGGDGSGKGTQARLFKEWLEAEGYNVQFESFPRYQEPVAEPISKFLNGEFGNPHPILASVPYALDRHMAASAIKQHLELPNSVFLADRFVDSNLGHNGAKYDTEEERLAYFEYERKFEYDTLGIPKPDVTLLFPVPPLVAQDNVDKKAKRDYTDKKRDIHEADAEHLSRAYDTYLLLAKTYPEQIKIVNPMESDGVTMRSMEAIHANVIATVRPLLQQMIQPL